MEYDGEREVRVQNPPSFAEASSFAEATADKTAGMEARSGDEEARLPISVMNEVIFILLSMPPEVRDVLCWRFSGMSYRDIATLQGITIAGAEVRLWRAMKKWPALRALFAEKAAKQARRKPASRSHYSEARKVSRKQEGRRVVCEK